MGNFNSVGKKLIALFVMTAMLISIFLMSFLTASAAGEPTELASEAVEIDCYINFLADAPYETSRNLSWEPQDSGKGTYGVVAGKGAYSTPDNGRENYLYCYVAPKYFTANDSTATVLINYYDDPARTEQNAIEIWYNKNGSNAWTPMIKFEGSGKWKTAVIVLETIDFANYKVNNGADFRITAKSPVSISSIKVAKGLVEPETAEGDCYIRFAADEKDVVKNNLNFVSGESPAGTYGITGEKGAYTTNTTGGETYLYCQIASGLFTSADTSATIIIEYFNPEGSSGDAFELYYKNRNNSDTWTSPRVQFSGDGRWKTEYIYLRSINFAVNKIGNDADFRITAKKPVSIASVRVEKGQVTDPGGNLTALLLDKSAAEISGYGRLKLNYTAEPANATISGVTWTSSNPDVAAVGTSGIVLAVSVGTARITATTTGVNGSFTAYCDITVKPIPAEGVEIVPGTLDLKVSEGKMINYWVTPETATNKVVRWTSSDESVATVTAHGYVTAVSAGKAVITATTDDGGFAAKCPVTVYPLENAGTVAKNALDFLMSIGVCSHVGQGDSIEKTIEALNYTGIRVVRDDNNTSYLNRFLSIAQATGVKYVMVNSGPNEGSLEALLNTSRTLANAGSLLALEGPNEPNNWAVNYYGLLTSSGSNNRASEIGLSLWMRDFYIGAKSDPVLKKYPVFASSEGGGSQYTNIGQQFLTVPEGAKTRMPDGTQFADYANVHNYICRQNSIIDNMAWTNASSDRVDWVDGIYAEYGRTWRSPGYDGYTTSSERRQLPKVTTETGWATIGPNTKVSHTPVTQEAQGKLFLNMYLSQYTRGFDHTFIYYLLDEVNQDCGFGFYDEYGSPKKSADYLHNMTTILNDDDVIGLLGDVNYTIKNQTETIHDLLLQKSDGTFELVVWNEKVSGSDEVMVDLGAVFSSVLIYDPTMGADPIRVLENVSSVALNLSDHPLILEFATEKNVPVDKTNLESLISTFEEINREAYTEMSWVVFSEALANALNVLGNKDATQDEVNKAAADLQAARNKLIEKESIKLVSVTPSAFVTKLNGSKNDLTITIIEKFSDGTENIITETLKINNNAAGTYDVGKYKVYVDTKGNTQIRECYIVK